MPYTSFLPRPGVSRRSTAYAEEGGWYEADKVRFRDGFPEVIGGWQDRELIGDLLGVCRTKLSWRANNGGQLEAFGSNEGLFVNSDGTLYDITPVRKLYDDVTDPLSVTSGSTTLTIEASAHESDVGHRLELIGFDLTSQGVSNSDLNTTHYVTAIPDANTIEVELPSAATGTVSGGGGTGDIQLLIDPGAEGTVFGNGFGAGAFGLEAYGTPRTTVVEASRARVWSLDTWGEQLVGTYRGGTPVKWDPTNDGLLTRASVIPNAPDGDFLLVTSPDRHLVLFSTVLPGESDVNRLAVRWCDQEDYTTWAVTATTTAGSQLLSSGSEVLAVIGASRQNLIWTDTSITSMQYIGPPYIFGFDPLDRTPEIASRNAVVEVNGMVMWAAMGAFYVYDGVARALDCPIESLVFEDYNQDQREKFFGVSNQAFQEVWWFYVSANSTEVDRYVIFNYQDNTWSHGSLTRTAAEDKGINDYPSAVDEGGTVFDHERGSSADGATLESFIESAPFDIAEGDDMMYVRGFVPDVRMVGDDTMEIVLKGRRYPQGPQSSHGPYTVENDTQRVRTRLRVRQVVIRYQSDSNTLFWQAGKTRFDLKPQGRY